MGAFLAWCLANKATIYGLDYIWHDRSEHTRGFYVGSHVVAYDVEDKPLQCARLQWDTARNMADIWSFLDKLTARVNEP